MEISLLAWRIFGCVIIVAAILWILLNMEETDETQKQLNDTKKVKKAITEDTKNEFTD